VQIAGKVRARLEVPLEITQDALEKLALADPAVQAALGGKPPSRAVIKPPKLVNLVP